MTEHATSNPPETRGTRRSSTDDALPGYRFIEYLHKTPLAEVWKVRDAEEEDRLAQFLHAAIGAGGDLLARLQELQHPALQTLEALCSRAGRLAVFSDPNRRTLRERYQECFDRNQPGIPREELLDYLKQTAEALDHFAGRQLYHLGLHPRCLVLSGDQVRVADFGLLQLAWVPTGQPVGPLNPRYAAPELQTAGVSAAADQYSLALLYAELLTGTHPYQGRAGQRASAGRAGDKLDLSFLPAPERPVVRRALDANPKKRFPDCRQFVDALEAVGGVMASKQRERFLQLPPVLLHARLAGTSLDSDAGVPTVDDLVPDLISAAVGAIRLHEFNNFRYLLHPGSVLEHHCHVRLFTGGLRLKLQGFHEEWKGKKVQEDLSSFTYHLFGARSLWQICAGQRPGLEVRVRLQPDPQDVQLFQGAIHLEPLNDSPAARQLVLDAGPTVLQSLRNHLQAAVELRAQERWAYDQPFRLYPVLADLKIGPVIEGVGLDISSGGMALLCPVEPPTGLAYLQLSQTQPLADYALLARLVRSKPRAGGFDIGAAFVGAAPQKP